MGQEYEREQRYERKKKKKERDSFLPLHLLDSSDLEQPHKFYIKDHGRHGEERANRFHYQNLEGNNFRTKQIILLDPLFDRIWLCRTVSLYSLTLHLSHSLPYLPHLLQNGQSCSNSYNTTTHLQCLPYYSSQIKSPVAQPAAFHLTYLHPTYFHLTYLPTIHQTTPILLQYHQSQDHHSQHHDRRRGNPRQPASLINHD